VYRWERILTAAGMDPLPQLQYRKSRLSDVASRAMSATAAA
jgi:hypothetical protein